MEHSPAPLDRIESRERRAARIRYKTLCGILQVAGYGAFASAGIDRFAKQQSFGVNQLVLLAVGLVMLGLALYLSPRGEP